jgi:hypothetical protein
MMYQLGVETFGDIKTIPNPQYRQLVISIQHML